jgi:DNA-binding SARP family transcriptional activator
MTNDRIEIRMFGRLFVRRSNGEVVDADEWSTGKTTDLLRLLALNANRPVSVHSVLDKLWPDVDEDKARASLRTAASRIRQVLGEPCVERHLGGLILRNAWSDVVAFQTIVHDASAAMHAHDRARVVSLAREAEALYVADFTAYDDKSSWAGEIRDSLKLSRQSLLADAGESAVQLLWMRDAIDFSTLAITEDPCFERPHRTLMRAHAGLGEIELALRAFEHCRVCLSQELGADPSPQTRALHIQMLSGDPDEVSAKPFAGRRDEVRVLVADLGAAVTADGCDVLCLTGRVGSGREALLEAAVARDPHSHLRRLLEDGTRSSDALRLASVISDRRSDITVWGSSDGDPAWELHRLMSFLSGVDPDVPRVIAVVTSDEVGDQLEARLAESGVTLRRHQVGRLAEADLSALASAVLSGSATPRLLAELKDQSDLLAGRAVTILRDWIASGWIISTINGLDLFTDPPAFGGVSPVGDYFRTTLEQMTLAETEFCQLLAMIDRPVSAMMLSNLSAADPDGPTGLDTLQSLLDELADLGVLRIGTAGYEFRNRAIRDAFEHRLRPSVKARLLRRVGQDFREETNA